MGNQDYITPTKGRPVFNANCTAFGTIETGMYKHWNVKKEGVINQVGATFACNFADAVNLLHEWIKENAEYVNEYPAKISFNIEVIDGSIDKYGDVNYLKVYSITAAKAKKYLL